jgi:FAD synthase
VISSNARWWRPRRRYVVVGEDFHFGRGRQGERGLLRDLGAEFGFRCR